MKRDPKEEQLRALMVRAFASAKSRGKTDWRRMQLSVLKNRLLHLTGRDFKEADYGAETMRELVEGMPDLLALGQGSDPWSVSLRVDNAAEVTDEGNDASDNASGAQTVPGEQDENIGFQAVLDQYRTNGDNLGVGEAYVAQLASVAAADVEWTFANIVSRWASSAPVDVEISGIGDLVANVDKFVDETLATAVVHAIARLESVGLQPPAAAGDLTFRVAASLRKQHRLPARTTPRAVMRRAITTTNERQRALVNAVKGFCTSPVVAARLPSIDVVKQAHANAYYALAGEQRILRDVEVLLGTLFRKFCESCEKYEAEQIPMRARDLRTQVQRAVDSLNDGLGYRLGRLVLEPVANHVSNLIEEGTRASEEMMMPSVRITGDVFKLNLADAAGEVVFPARVVNEGEGTAHAIRIEQAEGTNGIELSASEPPSTFDLAPGAERLVRLRLGGSPSAQRVQVSTTVGCQTANGSPVKFKQTLVFQQQRMQPDWDALLRRPPYAINPIRERKDLFGRDSILLDLELHVSNETSTFLWGQKRVGKTSVLQVLAANLREREDVACVLLRMGELASLHEGQLGHTVANRLAGALESAHKVPSEDEFRAGLGRLVPYVEELASESDRKMLVIIDEFDDLSPAFYLGERGKQFVKALRSLSEVGLTFMFVGSERMDSIYRSHSADLNKWVNCSLDRIEVETDCRALITRPVAGKIEYEPNAVTRIVEYCRGNPFYMHLVAGKLFRLSYKESRTFVGTTDVEQVRRGFVRELGPTNFAHFWQDVPVLDPNDKRRSVARNCLFLTCVSALGSGGYESLDDLVDVQAQMNLELTDRLPAQELQEVENGLLRRRVISRKRGRRGVEVELPVFRDWLLEKGEAELLPVWQTFQDEETAEPADEVTGSPMITDSSVFPIDEDDLLSLSEKLLYLGKQKDVAEVRRWLRQFDDDARIEVAFLLLKRLVEEGFVNDGAFVNGLAKMEKAVRARRQDVGDGAWRIARGRRLDNLYLAYVDSEAKSGAATARELAKRMGPGKCAAASGVPKWVLAHAESDPLVVIVDDFAGTGSTLAKGLERLWKSDGALVPDLAAEGRIICCLQAAFPEAVRRVKDEFAGVEALVMKTFHDEVRAFQPEAGIFTDDADRTFAQDVMLQIGRQLVPQHPLGYGNMEALVSFHNTIPNNTLPVFWSTGNANGHAWTPLLPRGSFGS